MITIKKLADVTLISCFASALYLPFADRVLGLDPVGPPNENRVLASFPELNRGFQLVKTFPADYEAYFNDHFGFRNSLIKGHGLLKYHLLEDSGSENVLIGQDGWLFFTGNRVVDCYRGVDPFSLEELEAWRRLLEARRDAVATLGIRYLFLFVPNKHTVYPEQLPERINVVNETTRLDQLTAHLRAHSDVDFIDLREVLIRSKWRGQLYERTGTHWTDQGKYFAYRTISELLVQWFPELEPLGPTDVKFRNIVRPGLGLAAMLGMREELREEMTLLWPRVRRARLVEAEVEALRRSAGFGPEVQLQVFVGEDPSLPRLMLVGDSFGEGLMPLIAQDFSRSIYLRQHFDPELIERQGTDLVIDEMVERFLMREDLVAPGGGLELDTRAGD